MLETATKVIRKIEDNGFKAYIVGGYVRDYLLDIKSNDVDICTNAKPKDLVNIFKGAILPTEDYGSVTIYLKNTRFEITTFRKEMSYLDYRRPQKVIYIDDLREDLTRRDFTINTLCMDKDQNIIDLLNGKADIKAKVIRTVGNANERLYEDALRILRAVRFATKLDFNLAPNVIDGINNNKHLLKNISYERKKEELDKIFASKNAKKGIKLLIDLELDDILELNNLKNITNTDSLIGIWAMIDIKDNTYRFSNNEKELMKDVRKALTINNLDPYNLYKYGLYVNSIAGSIKNISKQDIARCYENLIIHSRKELAVQPDDIIEFLNISRGPYIKEIYNELEKEVLYRRLKNNASDLKDYCLKHFS